MNYSGNIFIISAPSGAGKSSLSKALHEMDALLFPSISHTTRAPRGQEMQGREYHFVSEPEFDAMIDSAAFLEWAHVHGHRSGTSHLAITHQLEQGRDVLLEIDWQGANQVKKLFPQAISIFILPPSLEELRARIARRGEDATAHIELRMKNAEVEIAQAKYFDFVIINEIFERAVFDLKTIVHAQRLKYAAQRRMRPETFLALRLV